MKMTMIFVNTNIYHYPAAIDIFILIFMHYLIILHIEEYNEINTSIFVRKNTHLIPYCENTA